MKTPSKRHATKVAMKANKNLLGILRGEIDALDLLFCDGLMADMYGSMCNSSPAFEQLAVYVDALSHKDPNLRFLEIGAGIGGATKEMLQTLSHNALIGSHSRMLPFNEYVFTDISPAFFEKARERFQDNTDRMKFVVLNIEQDPLSQGFNEGDYDIIVASNVLHATADLLGTLANARKLLKPGGKLILCEIVDPLDFVVTFMFAILPGWWHGIEEERKWGSLLEEEGWSRYLSQSGFSGVDLSFQDGAKSGSHRISGMIARASPPLLNATTASELLIVLDPSSDCQVQVANLIDATLMEDEHVRSKRIELNEVSSNDSIRRPCVFLSELVHPLLDQISEIQYQNLQNHAYSSQGIIWVRTANDDSAVRPYMDMSIGLTRSLRAEIPTLETVTLNLQTSKGPLSMAHKILQVFRGTLLSRNVLHESEYIERDGLLCINRIRNAKPLNDYMLSRSKNPEPVLQDLQTLNIAGAKILLFDAAHFRQDSKVRFVESAEADAPLATKSSSILKPLV